MDVPSGETRNRKRTHTFKEVILSDPVGSGWNRNEEHAMTPSKIMRHVESVAVTLFTLAYMLCIFGTLTLQGRGGLGWRKGVVGASLGYT